MLDAILAMLLPIGKREKPLSFEWLLVITTAFVALVGVLAIYGYS